MICPLRIGHRAGAPACCFACPPLSRFKARKNLGAKGMQDVVLGSWFPNSLCCFLEKNTSISIWRQKFNQEKKWLPELIPRVLVLWLACFLGKV